MYHVKKDGKLICDNEPVKGDRIILFENMHKLNLDKVVNNKKIRYLCCKYCLNKYFDLIKDENIIV